MQQNAKQDGQNVQGTGGQNQVLTYYRVPSSVLGFPTGSCKSRGSMDLALIFLIGLIQIDLSWGFAASF
jgi:hypothetical protein